MSENNMHYLNSESNLEEYEIESSGHKQLSFITEFDSDLLKAGKHYQLYNKLGAHAAEVSGIPGTFFAVWAPNATSVSVVGNFNNWNKESHPMNGRQDHSGVWEVFIPGVEKGEVYKYFIKSNNGYEVEKGDPYGFQWELSPQTATVVWDLDYHWNDEVWLTTRKNQTILSSPISVYEIHLGSWRRNAEGEFLTYREMADHLPDYCNELGFTHVEMLPVMEHPFYGSWGYQTTGFFAPSSRYGTAQDFMFLIDKLHQAGIGVILDWVPSHFPTDEFALGYFDGTHLYEYADPRKGFHQDWKSFIFDLGRHEVRAFLISNALFWLDKFHIDGLRVDAVASMLYLDYSRKEGEWLPNQYGGRENLEAISFLQEFNDTVHTYYPDVFTVAEESTAWPGVTQPTSAGGLGFDMKWMMGWMHDTLDYFSTNPIYRNYHQGQLTFSLVYAFSEKFMLPLSHDEVVYGKGSLINKMPGDDWQQFANLRLLYGYMYGHPGAKLIFMGGEFAQRHEWQHDYSLDWHESEFPSHGGIQLFLRDLNRLYRKESSLYERNFTNEGFEWLNISDSTNSVIAWIRKGKEQSNYLVFVANFTPVVRENYRIPVPQRGYYTEVLNSDSTKYGGSDVLNSAEIITAPIPMQGRSHSLPLTLPPLGILVLKLVRGYEWEEYVEY